jgi:para-aminobenzoate synthetase component 1
VFLKDLFGFDEIMITNSLIGAVPVLSIDGKKLPKPSDLWKQINKALLYPS